MKNILKYFNIVKETILYCITRELQYRFNFMITFITVFAYQMSILFTYTIIYQAVDDIAGWSYQEMSLLFATNALIENVLFMPFVFYNLFSLPMLISTGDLDFELLKPICAVFSISFKRFDFGTCLGGLVAAIIYYLTAFPAIREHISLVNSIIYLLLVVNGFILMTAIFLIIQSLAFYFIRIEFVFNLFWALHLFGKRAPATIYPYRLRFLLTLFIPMLIISYYPAGILIHKLGLNEMAISCGITTLFVVASNIVWNRAIKQYSSASS